MRLLSLALALSASSALAQPTVPPDGLSVLPPPNAGDLRPLHASALRAYAYSAAATAGAVVLGVVVDDVIEAVDPVAYREDGLNVVGYVIAGAGLMLGPSAGNITLGAADDVAQAGRVKVVGALVGGAVILAGGLAPVATLATQDPRYVEAMRPTVYVGLGIVASGALIGGVMDLATIPDNARDARRLRQAEATTVGVGFSAGTPSLAVRVPL